MNLNFEDYKKVIKTMIMFGEELLWLDDKELHDREARRAILAAGNHMDDYWSCI